MRRLRITDPAEVHRLLEKGFIKKQDLVNTTNALAKRPPNPISTCSLMTPVEPADILYRRLVNEFGRYFSDGTGEVCYELAGVIPQRRFRLDCALPNYRVGIEMDGFQYHSKLDAFKRDREKWLLFTRLGWRIIPVSNIQVRQELDYIIESIQLAVSNSEKGRALCTYDINTGYSKLESWQSV